MKKRTQVIRTRIEPLILKKLKLKAIAESTTVSTVIRQAIKKHLK